MADFADTPTIATETTRRELLKALPLAGLALSANSAHAGMPGPDDEILKLGLEFEAAWKAEQTFYATHHIDDSAMDDLFEAAIERTETVVKKIEAAKADTLEGLKVKARAFEWCRGEDGFDLGDTTDVRLASQIIAIILKI